MRFREKVTVLISAYNAGNYIKECVNSLLNQTFTKFELLIINDGSNDDTEEKILSFEDSRIKYIRNDINLGVGNSVFNGMKLIDSEYIIRFDADDIAHKDWVESLVVFMEANPSMAICSSLFDVIGGISKLGLLVESPLQIRTRALFECPIAQYIIIRNQFLKENNITYNPSFKVAIDYDLYLKVLRFGEIAKIPKVLVKYRRHEASLTSKKYLLQDKISTDLRLKLLNELSGLALSDFEREVFMDFTFHRKMENVKNLDILKPTLKKIRESYFSQTVYDLDKKYYLFLENRFLRVFLIENKTMGFLFLYYYMKNFVLDFKIFMLFGLFLRIVKVKIKQRHG